MPDHAFGAAEFQSGGVDYLGMSVHSNIAQKTYIPFPARRRDVFWAWNFGISQARFRPPSNNQARVRIQKNAEMMQFFSEIVVD
jgi:hypothetical protein